jgi:cyclase
LLVHNGGLVKTRQFREPKYVGDPINAVRIFNEKEVDELIVVDIDATRLGREPDYSLIAKLANECRMPLCYGGGVRDEKQVDRIISLGVEKVSLSAAAIRDPALIARSATRVGSQSIIVTIDVRLHERTKRYEVLTDNATATVNMSALEVAERAQAEGAGEIVINSIDRDGMMQGYDLKLIAALREKIGIPVTALGGAGSLADIETLVRQEQIIGAAAGSLFVFKGKYRAVLISYPNRSEKDALLARAGADI